MPVVTPGYLVPRDVQTDFGFQQSIRPPNPGAGSGFKHVVPGIFFELPISVFCTFTTSATAANRLVHLVALDGDGNLVQDMPANGVQAAGLAGNYSWQLTVTAAFSPTTDVKVMPLFSFILPSGWSIGFTVGSMQAGDSFSGIDMVFQQFNTGLQPERFNEVALLDPFAIGQTSGPPVQPPSSGGGPAPPAPPAPPSPPPSGGPGSGGGSLPPGSTGGGGSRVPPPPPPPPPPPTIIPGPHPAE